MFARCSARDAAGVLAVVVFTALPRAADACTCIPAACGSVVQSAHLFEATVVAIDVPATSGGDSVVRLADVRAVKGDTAPTVLLGGDGASCAYQFAVGQRYLIDARESQPGRFTASSCGNTKPLAAAGGVLRYLSEAVPAERARVWGRVSASVMSLRDDAARPAIGGATITLKGPIVAETTSDRQGEFSFSDVPDGAYQLSISLPAARRDVRPPPAQRFVLDPSTQCQEVDVIAPSSAVLRGHVVDAAGRPFAGARVEFFPAPYNQWAGGIVHAAITGADGRYEIDGLAPGRYTGGLGVPYPSADRALAPVLARGPDGTATVAVDPGAAVVLPSLIAVPAPALTVSGRVSAEGGTPLGALMLVLQPLDGIGARILGGTTGPDGRFTLSAHRGVRYRVTVERGRQTVARVDFTAGGEELEIRLALQR